MSVHDAAVTVRSAGEEDVEAICRICGDGYRFVTAALLPAAVVDRMAREFYNPERVAREVGPTSLTGSWHGYVVAELDDRIIGAAGGGLVAPGVGQLYVIYLDLACRGRGVGSQLLAHVTAQQRSAGATRQRVAVLADNVHGLPFYRARGFEEVDRRIYPEHDPDGVVELVLERAL